MNDMHIILFDDDCLVCNRTLQFILKHDDEHYHFAGLQSEIGQQLIERFQLQNIDSVILIEDDKAYTQSTAVWKIASHLNGFWRLGVLLAVVPKPIRNLGYNIVAKNRKKIPLKQCVLLTPAQRKRFLS